MHEGKEQLPLDAKLLSLALIELNISRRNVAIYPENHPSIRQSINKAFGHLQSLFELRSEITLAVAKDTLIIDEHQLDKKNPVYAELAHSLFNMGIGSVTFTDGITGEEITKFHKILTTESAALAAKGGILAVIQSLGISHITLGLIDYGAFHFAEGEREPSDGEMNIWEDYIYGLLKGKLFSEADEEKLRGISPAVFAQIINRAMPDEGKQDSYERVITTYLKKSSDEGRLRKGALSNISTFIEGLKPSLKKQFLSGTFKYISPDPVLAQKISSNLTPEQMMGMLSEINERDEIIPDTLKNLLEKFSKVKQKDITIDTRRLSTGDSVIDDIQLSPEVIKLFEKDRFQDHISSSYKEELNKILAADFVGGQELPTGEIQAECGDEQIERFLTDLLLAFLDMEDFLTEDEIQKIADRFIENINSFLETGQFDELVVIYDVMTEKSSQGKHEIMTAKIFAYITSAEFIENLLSSYRFWGRKNREDVVEFSRRLRIHLLEPMLNALTAEDDAALRRFYLSVLAAFGEDVVPFALDRLSDERWFVKRNMLCLLRECGDRSVLKHIRPFCESGDFRIVMEAMKAFLHFQDNGGMHYIKKYLASSDAEVRDQTVKMIGSFRVKLLVPDLIKLLLKKDLLGGDFHLKIPIVRALGEIGDERAIRYLQDICMTKSLLYKGSLGMLKTEIYKSLKNYPFPAIKHLVDEGMNSKNEEIIGLCRRIMDFYGKTEKQEKT